MNARAKLFTGSFLKNEQNKHSCFHVGATLSCHYLCCNFNPQRLSLVIVQGTRAPHMSQISLSLNENLSETRTSFNLKYFPAHSNNLVTDGEREFRTHSAQNFGDKMPMFTRTDKVFNS